MRRLTRLRFIRSRSRFDRKAFVLLYACKIPSIFDLRLNASSASSNCSGLLIVTCAIVPPVKDWARHIDAPLFMCYQLAPSPTCTHAAGFQAASTTVNARRSIAAAVKPLALFASTWIGIEKRTYSSFGSTM